MEIILLKFIMLIINGKIMIKKKTYIIAEIGNNHNGNYKLAKKSIIAAAASGADAVKFQSYTADEFMSNKNLHYTYRTTKGYYKENMYEMFKRIEFRNSWYLKLFNLCKHLKIDFLSSAADKNSVDRLISIGSIAIKVASEDIINYPLLEYISKKKQNIILSTGMADEKEIKKALTILRKNKVYLLHCVSLYPTKIEDINLGRMIALKKFKKVIGFSDHTQETITPSIAVSLGAKIIEKHFTLSKNLKGPDHGLSLDPKEFRTMVSEIRIVEKMSFKKRINPYKKEIKIRKKFRRSIVANQSIKNGEKILDYMLSLKRPGTGLHPIHLNKIIGSKAKKNYKKNSQIE